MLRCYNYPYSASEFSTENLRILHIKGRDLEIPWEHESEAPLELRELYISASRLSKIPDSIGQMKHLEMIVLSGDDIVSQLPLKTLVDEFCQLLSLKHLQLRYCKYLRSLPDSFGKLTHLQHFELYLCSRMEMLPDSFGDLTNLQHLEIYNCNELRNLPDSFGDLTNLQHLEIFGCNELQKLPDSFGNLNKLQHITLTCCTKLEMLPTSFGNLTKLLHIDLSDCQNLLMLPNSFGNLIELNFLCLIGCNRLTIFNETLRRITTLENFSLSGCTKNIRKLPPQLTYQRFLEEMYLGFDFKELPSDIGNLCNLKILVLESSSLEMLAPLFGHLRSLEDLTFIRFPLKCFPDSIRMLTQLKRLKIVEIKNVEQLEFKGCPSREVTFQNVVGEVETVTDLRGRGVPSKMDASEASYLINVVFPNLQHLQIEYCNIVEVGALPNTLQTLHIRYCKGLVEVGALPTTLQRLEVCHCRMLEELPNMQTLVSLEKLDTTGGSKLKRIH